MSVLVVGFDPVFQQSLINLLLICGMETFEVASNRRKALEKISKTLFDVVLINFFLPDTTGLQLAEELLKSKPGSKIILIIEDRQLAALDKVEQTKLNSPTILKSFVNRVLPELLADCNSKRESKDNS
jgi:CheY-like chemotaxis protein